MPAICLMIFAMDPILSYVSRAAPYTRLASRPRAHPSQRPVPSSTVPPRPSNTRPCVLTSSSSLAPMRPSSTVPARPIAVPAQAKSQSGKSSATHGSLCAIKGYRVSGGIRAAVAQGTVASAKKILWDSLLRKTMANTKERIDALEAQIRDMIKSDPDAPGILKQFSLRLDALEVNLEATDNA
ncbi:hypothetical protein RJ639_044571 [Escallonia herrerae]|uniref:Uncharacterized protein n=1 Tax=Escallonia herrerae TaxID=1293975 RepID=A0AA88WH11_9ASTE|nr:hypothetical protein RJ639_044571 [Escallonia herrerae]